MKFLKCILIASAIFLSGCVNLYVRSPGTPSKITTVYQSTQASAALSYVVMFPQVMASGEHDTFVPENIITIPCGIVCFCDTALEAVVDTVCLPYDWPISNYRINHIRRDAEFQPCYCK